ncbi:hypothetical protein [Phaeodactylibacter xiamenensis]|jgi:hypothetical protein|uniref:hypothetical protein n=1 Tax=Phaeodactylibacter xiamenensis TaxID=1524460 RepID=UPI003CCBBF87
MKTIIFLLIPFLQLLGAGSSTNGLSAAKPYPPSLLLASSEELPPYVTVSWRFCGGISGCRHCCLTLKSPQTGAHEWEMHPVLPNGQYIYGGTPYMKKTTSGNVWIVGMIGDPDCFIIRYRQAGGQWQNSQKICPSSQCCYP